MKKNITIIGTGNLGMSLFQGIHKNEKDIYANITLTKKTPDTIQHLKGNNVIISSNNQEAVKDADIILLCVKPHQLQDVAKEIKPMIKQNALIISTITGKNIHDIKTLIGGSTIIVRAMPNTASAVQESITCVNSNSDYSKEHVEDITALFECIGKVIFIEEKLMNSATVLGACGIAYALRFIRAMIQGGIEIGFDAKTATDIATQTVRGASHLLSENKQHPEEEIDKVTTPMGCTIKGLNEMEHYGFSSSLMKGIIASYKQIS